jgi:hypothetical protein
MKGDPLFGTYRMKSYGGKMGPEELIIGATLITAAGSQGSSGGVSRRDVNVVGSWSDGKVGSNTIPIRSGSQVGFP